MKFVSHLIRKERQVFRAQNIPDLVACEELAVLSRHKFCLVLILCGINLRHEIGLMWHRAGCKVRRRKVNVKGIVEEAIVKTISKDVALRLSIASKQLRVELEVICRRQETHVVHVHV